MINNNNDNNNTSKYLLLEPPSPKYYTSDGVLIWDSGNVMWPSRVVPVL